MANLYTLWWKKNAFKVIVFCSLCILVVAMAIQYNKAEEGSWSDTYFYDPTPMTVHKNKRSFPTESAGEKEARAVLERIFKRPFVKKRPLFLMNEITGKPLEIDCMNDELKLGVEYNGRQHYQFVPGMHKNYDAFRNQQYRDDIKRRLCKENGYTLIEIPYTIPNEKIENFLRTQLTYHRLI